MAAPMRFAAPVISTLPFELCCSFELACSFEFDCASDKGSDIDAFKNLTPRMWLIFEGALCRVCDVLKVINDRVPA